MAAPATDGEERLDRSLGLLDVYAIATGAMFSSGFFLLPGIASAETGPSVVLAYLAAGILVLPAMLSAAELSTAMPRAGGPYYFLDRSLGPLFGTIGGIGTWTALIFKSAFALVGMGAYLGLFFDLAVRPLAIALAVAFVAINILGVRKTSRLQLLLVALLVGVLAYFVVAGALELLTGELGPTARERFMPFFTGGTSGFVATIGLVFVSYAGLTQVASVAEEVRDPGRTIPLGMVLSLLTATTIYVAGVALMVAVVDPAALADDLTPVATVADELLPQPIGLILVVAAAIAAFASTGNAGLLAAARYPLGMARDRLLWARLARIGRTGTPVTAIVVTGALAVVSIAIFDVEAIASLASAFMLLIFGLINLAVIVMRESRIGAYDPRFRSPLYPWTQLLGIVVTVVLVFEIGPLSVALTVGLLVGCVVYYLRFARDRVERDGAIYHVFERWGRRRDVGLDRELFGILQEQGLRHADQFDQIVARAAVIDLDGGGVGYVEATRRAARALTDRVGGDAEDLTRRFTERADVGAAPVANGVPMPYVLLSGTDGLELAIVRSREGIRVPGAATEDGRSRTTHALVFLAGDEDRGGQVLRVLAQFADHVVRPGFAGRWLAAGDEQEIKEALLADERMVAIHVTPDGVLDGAALRDLTLPPSCLIALIRRGDRILVPRGSTTLHARDRLTVIGDPAALRELTDEGLR